MKTIPDKPQKIREQAVRALLREVPADFGMYFDCVESEGSWYYTSPVFQGDEGLQKTFGTHIDTPVFESPWTRRHIDQGQIDSFIRSHAYFSAEKLYEFETQQKLMRPLQITDELRAVFFDGRRFFGWLGLVRRDIDEAFTREEEKVAESKLERFKSALLMADVLEQDIYASSMMCVVMTPDGTAIRASRPARAWLTQARSATIGRMVRGYDRGRHESPTRVLDGAELRIVRMDGGAVRYAVHIERAAEAEVEPEALLTERQQEVAEYAAVGATNGEIAKAMGVSESTVKYHLKRVYRRLGVEGRVELGWELGGK